MRIFFLSYTPPLPSWGSAMTFYRHFVERPDFETFVATNSDQVHQYTITYRPLLFQVPALWRRLTRTRLAPWVYGAEYLHGRHLLPSIVTQAAERFRPDAVFTMAGSWDWTALAAQQLARRLSVPLVASFNDWFDYGAFLAAEPFRPRVEARFLQFYREADLALCTSDGMKEALGDHPNAHVLYPTGARMALEDPAPPRSEYQPFTIFFGGSLGDWYGPMIESLVTHIRDYGSQQDAIRFRIFGSLQSWSGEFDAWATAAKVFGGRLPFDQLAVEAGRSDLLLLPMGFDADCAHVERTSFKTKFLDYLSFRRPILIWAPEYSSAVRVAREYDSAECVTDPAPTACAERISRLAADPSRRAQLIQNARRMYEDRFHPDTIHGGLVEKMRRLCGGPQS
ncbi:MAG: glycosyltransferase [Acidobacteria bacterium]|nr:glycosyltransferase [Acidobacteriota bacterium]